jgi:hypothetical protein
MCVSKERYAYKRVKMILIPKDKFYFRFRMATDVLLIRGDLTDECNWVSQ